MKNSFLSIRSIWPFDIKISEAPEANLLSK